MFSKVNWQHLTPITGDGKNENRRLFSRVLVVSASSQWLRKPLQPSQPAAVAQFHPDDTGCAVAGRFAGPCSSGRSEPGGATGLSESCTMTSSHAEVTFKLRDRPPPSGCLRLTRDSQSSTRPQPHCDRSLHSRFVQIKLLSLFSPYLLPFTFTMCVERWKEMFFLNLPGCLQHGTCRRLSDKYI